jgi:hypothetical protein
MRNRGYYTGVADGDAEQKARVASQNTYITDTISPMATVFGLLNTDDEGLIIFQSIRNDAPKNPASYLTRLEASATPP